MNLTYDEVLSKYAFNCNLRHYTMMGKGLALLAMGLLVGRCRLTPG